MRSPAQRGSRERGLGVNHDVLRAGQPHDHIGPHRRPLPSPKPVPRNRSSPACLPAPAPCAVAVRPTAPASVARAAPSPGCQSPSAAPFASPCSETTCVDRLRTPGCAHARALESARSSFVRDSRNRVNQVLDRGLLLCEFALRPASDGSPAWRFANCKKLALLLSSAVDASALNCAFISSLAAFSRSSFSFVLQRSLSSVASMAALAAFSAELSDCACPSCDRTEANSCSNSVFRCAKADVFDRRASQVTAAPSSRPINAKIIIVTLIISRQIRCCIVCWLLLERKSPSGV